METTPAARPLIAGSGAIRNLLSVKRMAFSIKNPESKPVVLARNNSRQEAHCTDMAKGKLVTRYKQVKKGSHSYACSFAIDFFITKYQTGKQRSQPVKENRRIKVISAMVWAAPNSQINNHSVINRP